MFLLFPEVDYKRIAIVNANNHCQPLSLYTLNCFFLLQQWLIVHFKLFFKINIPDFMVHFKLFLKINNLEMPMLVGIIASALTRCFWSRLASWHQQGAFGAP